MLEAFSIYNPDTGAIRLVGIGPKGTAAIQRLLPGERVAPFYSDPNTQRVVTGPDGKPALQPL